VARVALVHDVAGVAKIQAELLRSAGHRFRGRVLGVRMLAIYSLPLGLLTAGALIEVRTVR